jgi:serine/threonine protein kinase
LSEGNQSELWETSTQELHYLCVCGEELELEKKASSIQCPKCKRIYGAEAFQNTINYSFQTQSLESSTSWSDLASTLPERSLELHQGDHLEHFKIVGILGKGGMGAVYRAVDESLERYVALKVIEKKISKSNQSEYERLLQEARAQARLNHPNVVQIFYIQHKTEGSAPFFAMELVQGETLEDRLKAGDMPFAEVIEVALQISDALKHARIYDTVHGDIKPGNILYASRDVVKLADFGLSRKVSESDEDEESNAIGGTPAYLAPEIARGESSDYRSDMYSLGVMLFQMSFGRMPYEIKRKVLKSYLDAHKHAEIKFPSKWPVSVPEKWKDVLQKLLAKNPEDRYADYDELLSDLKLLRPQNYPVAGRLSRGLAWLIDLSIAFGLNFIFVFPILNNVKYIEDHPVVRMFALVLPLIVPYLVCFLQGYWKISPGKKLFQICIMDKHGKRLNRSKLEFRMAMQMLPLLLANIAISLNLLGTSDLARLIILLGSIFFLLDFVLGFFAQERRSLHDRILGTRVVIDLKGHEVIS